MTTDRSFSFVFVCQAGRLELEALLLALSLRRFVTCEFEMIAAVPVPSDVWGTPQVRVLDELERVGVRIVEVENAVDRDYPIGNKVGCLSIPTDCDTRVFLDSDVVCLRPFSGGPEFDVAFAAKPADLITKGLDERAWRRAYGTVGLQLPPERMAATVDGKRVPPYFNAGVVAVDRRYDLGAAWSACCRAIDADPSVHPKRPWLDQIALPVAVLQLGLEFGLLTEQYNFPAHLRQIDERRPPVLCHYHEPKFLARSAHAADVVRQLADECPLLWSLMSDQPSWRPLTRLGRPSARQRIGAVPGVRRAKRTVERAADSWHVRRLQPAEIGRDAIVTGLPRSGTSLFSSLLNGVPNVVCLNEIGRPTRTFRTFRTIRRKIESGHPIPNKYDRSGALATDTFGGEIALDERTVSVIDDRFVLAQKLTLPYLNRLEELCDQGLAVWVMVRHPLFTIESWKRSPQHFAIAGIDPPHPLLAHIPLPGAGADERRVAIWNHYAGEIDRLRGRLEIVRYEDLVADPSSVLARFCDRFDLEHPAVVPDLESRNRDPGAIAPGLIELVSEKCEMGRFGYE